MNPSVNLTYAAHYDANNVGVGINVWIGKVPNHSMDSYFILPSLILQDNRDIT